MAAIEVDLGQCIKELQQTLADLNEEGVVGRFATDVDVEGDGPTETTGWDYEDDNTQWDYPDADADAG